MMRWTFLIGFMTALFVTSPVLATTILATQDSGTFAYQLNDSTSTADFSVSDVADNGAGIMGFSGLSSIVCPAWNTLAAAGTLIQQGYTVEYRARVESNGDSFGIGAMLGDGSQLAWIGARTDSVFTQFPYTNLQGGANNDDLHVFRFAHVAGDAYLSVWRDGRLLTESAGLYADASQMSSIGWISTQSGSGQVDYFRWTPGAYAPVPEPSTILLGCLGIAGLLAYAWRKRR
jgi:hypothetical protein